MKGRDGLGDTSEVEPGSGGGGRDAVLGTRGPVCDLVSRERCLPLHIHTHTHTHTHTHSHTLYPPSSASLVCATPAWQQLGQ